MEYNHEDEDSVLKSKMDHSITNRSLKELLKRQRQAQMMCDAKYWQKAFALQRYIDQELEIHVGIAQARKKLHDKFKEYTAQLNKQIMNNRKNIEPTTSKADLASLRSKSSEIEVDLNQRSSEISELQRDIHTAEQDTNSRAQWNNIDTVFEAKFAIKYIFKQLIDSKRILQTKMEDHKTRYDDIKQSYEKLKEENEKIKKELAAKTDEYDMKITKAAKQRDVDVSIIQSQRKHNESLENKNKYLVAELKKLIEQISWFSKIAGHVTTAAKYTLQNVNDEENGGKGGLSGKGDSNCVENSSTKRTQREKGKATKQDKKNASVETPNKQVNSTKNVTGNIHRENLSEWKATPLFISSKDQNKSKNSTTVTESFLSDVTNSTVISQRDLSPKVNQSKHATSKLSGTSTSTQSIISGTVCSCRGSCLPTCRCRLSGLGCGTACFCPCLNNKARQKKNKRSYVF